MSIKIATHTILLITASFIAQISQAEIKEYVRDYNYHGADFDTRETSRVNAIDGVKRELLDELGTYVGSVVKMHQDSLGNSYMSHDVINITAGIVAMKVLSEKWNQPEYFVKAGMKADPDDVLTKLKAMRADLELEKSLRDSHEELQHIRNEMAQLKAQLAEMAQLKVQLAQIKLAQIDSSVKLAQAPVPLPVPQTASPTAEQAAPVKPATPVKQASPPVNAQLSQVELTRDIAAEKSRTAVETKPTATPLPEEKLLVTKYVKAVHDIEVETAYQRALFASKNGNFLIMLKEMSELAEKGYARAQNKMGWINERGLGVVQDYKKAYEWYVKASANGDTDANARIGKLYEHGWGVEKDYDKAANYYQHAIRDNSDWGYTHLGYLYETGKGVKLNREQAVEHYRIGTEKGNYLAMARLGFMYQLGLGVTKNELKAVELYKQAVEHGQPVAMTRLGQMYNLGHGGLMTDHAKALSLIRESVRYNLPISYAFMGFMYENGWEVTQDYVEAKKWYDKAADQDAPFAEFRLGILYKDGKGVSQDRKKAIYWLERAASKGNDKAAEILKRMSEGRANRRNSPVF